MDDQPQNPALVKEVDTGLPASSSGGTVQPPPTNVSTGPVERKNQVDIAFQEPVIGSVEAPSIALSEVGPEISPELVGVVRPVAQPSIPVAAQAVGVKPAGEAAPVPTEPSGIVNLPTEGQIKEMMRGKNFTDSSFWKGVLSWKERFFGGPKKPIEQPV